ncbi:restriction endonuclease subunit S [uncultured Treponema sp.]|uniref:restriction endonuclease subunit S n=1 Tax=uncultured Treponema sp. TaxID=162155 RepID=UPI00280B5C46|nr:restriction endonuclease subunit S [uncultured Treponema sp.]
MTAKDLKNALLQEAVQGKLVPQIASEGNARDLLEEIRKEKLSHGLDFANAKSGKRKSKKETALAGSNPCDITEEEIPFDIPESWCWCRLGEICTFENGDRSSNYPVEIDYTSDGIPFFGAADMKNNKLLFSDNLRFIPEEKFDSLRSGKLQNKDYVMLLRGAVGKWAQFLNHGKYSTGFINAQMVIIRAYESIVEYIKVLFNSPIFEIFLRSKTTGTAVAQMSAKDLSTLLIPLPPLAEQKRIVAAIEKFMPLIEEYGKKETQLKAINEKIGILTKKAILQEAVQGKLVPQIAAEGNAKDLLEEIKKEKTKLIKEGKIKKEKTLPEITEDEIPFDIPENWCWCRLGEIVNYKMGKTPPRAESEWWGDKNDIPWISIADMVADGHINKTKEFMSWKAIKEVFNNTVSKAGTLIMSFKLTVGRVSILDIDATHNEAIISIYPYIDSDYCTRNYLFKVLPLLSQNGETKDAIKGRTLNSTSLSNMLIPLPPLNEQKRIVAAIEKILPLCEKLGE